MNTNRNIPHGNAVMNLGPDLSAWGQKRHATRSFWRAVSEKITTCICETFKEKKKKIQVNDVDELVWFIFSSILINISVHLGGSGRDTCPLDVDQWAWLPWEVQLTSGTSWNELTGQLLLPAPGGDDLRSNQVDGSHWLLDADRGCTKTLTS